MANSETLALAAHLHVLLRRKIGRVTDTEWLASNAEYAREILRVAREAGDGDLNLWADRFEAAMFPPNASAERKPLLQPADDACAPLARPASYLGRLR